MSGSKKSIIIPILSPYISQIVDCSSRLQDDLWLCDFHASDCGLENFFPTNY